MNIAFQKVVLPRSCDFTILSVICFIPVIELALYPCFIYMSTAPISKHLQPPSYPCPLRVNEEISIQAEIINQKSRDITVNPKTSLKGPNYTGKLHKCSHHKFKSKNTSEKISIIRSGFKQWNKNHKNIKKIQWASLDAF